MGASDRALIPVHPLVSISVMTSVTLHISLRYALSLLNTIDRYFGATSDGDCRSIAHSV